MEIESFSLSYMLSFHFAKNENKVYLEETTINPLSTNVALI